MHIDLTHLEELAKFRVAEGERERFVQSFENILDYVGQLQQVETDEADAISTITPMLMSFARMSLLAIVSSMPRW
jgi:aspartyl/glutamyl-tRNA(Asn/Gln) amidotransferase C subunit